jgi:hypothetical protein
MVGTDMVPEKLSVGAAQPLSNETRTNAESITGIRLAGGVNILI